jgi:peptide chain release factor 2
VGIFDIPKRQRELEALEAQSAEPGLWDDAERAQRTMQMVARVRDKVEPYFNLKRRIEDAGTLLELAELEEGGEAFEGEIRSELAAILAELDALEVKSLLTGPHDAADAIVELKPGAGGTDACDWGAMLLRMYLRWAEENGFKAEIKDEQPGDVAGISSATVFISGTNAYGLLKSEHGVHRLVRISPFNSNGKRQTSFAAVEVLPQVDFTEQVKIDEKDLEIDTYRSSGAGGQHVNKTSSAVRITHVPTGIVVQCQNERSQLQNKEVALRVLAARLAELAEREAEEKLNQLRGEQRSIEWGSQIRSYVFQPYQMVKDHRTGVETGDVQRVMDGDLGDFITGYLKWRAEGGKEVGDGDTLA